MWAYSATLDLPRLDLPRPQHCGYIRCQGKITAGGKLRVVSFFEEDNHRVSVIHTGFEDLGSGCGGVVVDRGCAIASGNGQNDALDLALASIDQCTGCINVNYIGHLIYPIKFIYTNLG